MDLKGKKAVVFGGTSGIGLATTRMLADAGATVVTVSRDPSKATNLPEGVTTASCDVQDRDAVAAVCSAAGPYDVLISAATGGPRAAGPFMEMDLDAYQNSFAKVWGYANVLRQGVSHLKSDGCAVLVSGAPARKARPGQVAISSAGGAVEALARCVAKEIVPKRLNVVSPGVIDTPMFGPDEAKRKEMTSNATKANLIPRAGTAEEVAQAIMLVVQNDFMTGVTVDVDGGWLNS